MDALMLDVRWADVLEDARAMLPGVLWGDPGTVFNWKSEWPRARSLGDGIDAGKVAGHPFVDKPAEGTP